MEPRCVDRRWRGVGIVLAIALALTPAVPAGAVSLCDLRTSVNPREGYTRCVVELTGTTRFFERDFLAAKKYFLVDIYDVRPAVAERFITPATGPVRQILVLNRKDPDTQVLTLVFYLTDTRRYRVFTVENPFRIVVDVFHSAQGTPVPTVQPASVGEAAPTAALTSLAPASPASPPQRVPRIPGRKVIILDPGHGGSDPGALGALAVNRQRVQEKDINLEAAKQLQRLVNSSPNMVAYMTRETDVYVSLRDRVKFCEQYFGDLFVSIHCNAADSRRARGARGIEFYYLNPSGASSSYLRWLEQVENLNGRDGEDSPNWDLPILQALARESLLKWLTEGRVVCEYLKKHCYEMSYYRQHNNRENVVQSARFRVLYQAEMPAVLVELGFLTNADECRRLLEESFQEQVATALYNGIASYFQARDELFKPQLRTLPAGP